MEFIVQSQTELKKYSRNTHQALEKDSAQISLLIRQNKFATRSVILFCFSLMEAYLNGLAWDYMQSVDVSTLSNTTKKLLEDAPNPVSLRKKLEKYPQKITGSDIWLVQTNKETLNAFLNIVKPFRDSLVHPSPFSAPEKLGGHDKLRLLYRIDYDTGLLTANLLVSLLELLHFHVYSESKQFPEWFTQLKQEVENASNVVRKIEVET